MTFQYLDHVADIGLQGTGESLAEAMEAAAQGMLELMVDIETIDGRQEVNISAQGVDYAALFVALLNQILAELDIQRMFFRSVKIDNITEDNGVWHVEGTLTGESIDLTKHAVNTEVKAATYSGLLVEIEPDQALVRCVLDI